MAIIRCTYAAIAADPVNAKLAMLLEVTREGERGRMRVVSTTDTGRRLPWSAAEKWCAEVNASPVFIEVAGG